MSFKIDQTSMGFKTARKLANALTTAATWDETCGTALNVAFLKGKTERISMGK